MAALSLQALYEAWDYYQANPPTGEGMQDIYLLCVRRALGDPNYVLSPANRAAVKTALYHKAWSATGRMNTPKPEYQYSGKDRRRPEFSKLRSILDERKQQAIDVDFKDIEDRVESRFNKFFNWS